MLRVADCILQRAESACQKDPFSVQLGLSTGATLGFASHLPGGGNLR